MSFFHGPRRAVDRGTSSPQEQSELSRGTVRWAKRELPETYARQTHYRISGITGSGKSNLTRLFLIDALREVERNDAKLVVFEPKREFYSWILTIRHKYNYSFPVNYFMPSDTRGVALEFWRDYPTDQDSRTLANAFYPPHNANEREPFWGNSLRTIYAQVFDAIKGQLGYADLRLMCLVLEDQALTRDVLGTDLYLVQARELLEKHGQNGSAENTARNIWMTIQARIAEMKVLAAHLEQARQEGRTFSLSNFVRLPGAGVLVVSKDEVYSLVHDPMNGVLFLRLMELLNQLQENAVRRVYVIIDEFPMLCGDHPCPGIEKILLLLRSRGVSVLFTYQAHVSLTRIYGEEMANEIVGQTSNVIYLKQGDVKSAEYAAEDLGRVQEYETITSVGISGGMSGDVTNSSWNIQKNPQWIDRPIYSATELMNHLRPADAAWGVEGRVKCAAVGNTPFAITYAPAEIAAIPKTSPDFENYMRRDPELGEDFKKYIELMRRTQRLQPLGPEEREALLKPTTVRPESEPWDTCQD